MSKNGVKMKKRYGVKSKEISPTIKYATDIFMPLYACIIPKNRGRYITFVSILTLWNNAILQTF